MKRIFYKIINPFRAAYWFVFRPQTRGVKCLIEHKGKFLMIRNTYGLQHWTFPGGGVKRREEPKMAARREAHEEVGILLQAPILIGEYTSTRQYKRDTVHCFYSKAHSDYFKIDNDEVLEAAWFASADIPPKQSPAVKKGFDLLANLS